MGGSEHDGHLVEAALGENVEGVRGNERVLGETPIDDRNPRIGDERAPPLQEPSLTHQVHGAIGSDLGV